ncbi:hypothetical protein KA107_00145 [Candidatus Pacearchaeota archaeon]|nr:hypothetical protein [Candidatus Pacearchaeota archaeon]
MKYNIKINESEGRHAYSVTVNGHRYGADLNHLPRGKNGNPFFVVDGLGIIGLTIGGVGEAYFSAVHNGMHDCGIVHSLPELSPQEKRIVSRKAGNCKACRDHTQAHHVLGLLKKVAEDYFSKK